MLTVGLLAVAVTEVKLQEENLILKHTKMKLFQIQNVTVQDKF